MENKAAPDEDTSIETLESLESQECAICLQKMELPVELPCKSVNHKEKLSRSQSTFLFQTHILLSVRERRTAKRTISSKEMCLVSG